MLIVTPIDTANERVFMRLSQNYEAEFSPLTGKRPNPDGSYEITRCDASHLGYLLWDDATPIGFAVINTSLPRFDVSEFYIIPSERRGGAGKTLAHWVFSRHPGEWQVRQIAGADWAHRFWVRVVEEYTGGQFSDSKEEDSEWGVVDVQRFVSVAPASNPSSDGRLASTS